MSNLLPSSQLLASLLCSACLTSFASAETTGLWPESEAKTSINIVRTLSLSGGQFELDPHHSSVQLLRLGTLECSSSPRALVKFPDYLFGDYEISFQGYCPKGYLTCGFVNREGTTPSFSVSLNSIGNVGVIANSEKTGPVFKLLKGSPVQFVIQVLPSRNLFRVSAGGEPFYERPLPAGYDKTDAIAFNYTSKEGYDLSATIANAQLNLNPL